MTLSERLLTSFECSSNRPREDPAKANRERWWRFAEPLVAMREALAPLERYIAVGAG